MDSLHDMLADRVPNMPPEIEKLKQYVFEEFGMIVQVTLHRNELVVQADDAGLVNTLRLRAPEIQQICETDKRLVFRTV